MPGIPRTAAFGVTRVRPRFTEDLGDDDPPTGSVAGHATGFWVVTPSEPPDLLLVTNKHVVDHRLSHPRTPLRLCSVEIELRRVRVAAELDIPRDTRFFRVANLDACLFVAETADCAIICNPTWEGEVADFTHTTAVCESMLGTKDAFERGEVEFCDPVAFIGFPSTRKSTWWDQKRTLPIAREASIASLPDRPFEHSEIKTSDVVLVSGLSFSGSSGSPVFTHRKHVVMNAQWFDPLMGSVAVREPVLVGIMSGHFDDDAPAETPEMFRHSGLSYMTRSTTIVDLIAHARSSGFRNTRPFDGLNSLRMALGAGDACE